MVHLRKDLNSCWTPCFWHNNVHDGSLAVAIYSFFMSLAVVTYCVYIMTGGDTSQLWLPFFETDLKDTLQGGALNPIILVCSAAIRRKSRLLYFPTQKM